MATTGTSGIGISQRVTRGARLSGSDRKKLTREIVRRYKAGDSIRAIAEDSGRSYGSVHKALTEAGVTRRRRGGATRGPSAARKASAKKTTAKKTTTKKTTAKRTPVKKAAAKKAPAKKATASKTGARRRTR